MLNTLFIIFQVLTGIIFGGTIIITSMMTDGKSKKIVTKITLSLGLFFVILSFICALLMQGVD